MWLVKKSSEFIRLREQVVLVGCGGTGSLVAEGLCRLFYGNDTIHLTLIDPDVVEPHNVLRQLFYPRDVGAPKAEVLARRLSANFGRRISYVTLPWHKDAYAELSKSSVMDGSLPSHIRLIIGCVDNHTAREAIQASLRNDSGYSNGPYGPWWLDAGNGAASGQVYIGNSTLAVLERAKSFISGPDDVLRLPLPTVQQPALLQPTEEETARLDCAQAVALGDQSPTINQAMATLVLEYTRRLFQGTLPWRASFIDLQAGSLSSVEASPERAAKLLSIPVRTLVEHRAGAPRCPECGEVHAALKHGQPEERPLIDVFAQTPQERELPV